MVLILIKLSGGSGAYKTIVFGHEPTDSPPLWWPQSSNVSICSIIALLPLA